jgi:hypothetical protein
MKVELEERVERVKDGLFGAKRSLYVCQITVTPSIDEVAGMSRWVLELDDPQAYYFTYDPGDADVFGEENREELIVYTGIRPKELLKNFRSGQHKFKIECTDAAHLEKAREDVLAGLVWLKDQIQFGSFTPKRGSFEI